MLVDSEMNLDPASGYSRWPVTRDVKGSGAVVAALLCLIVAFRPEIFFSVFGLLGLRYEGSESGSKYWVSVIVPALLIYAYVAHLLISGCRLGGTRLLAILVPFLFITIYLLDSVLGRTQTTSASNLLLALAFAGPAVTAGALASRPRVLYRLPYPMELLMLLLTAAVGLSALGTLGGGIDRGIGGATYQTAAYMGALAFNINLYFVFFGRRSESGPGFAQSKFYSVLAGCLLPAQVLGVLLAGGRGAFVLVIVGVVVQLSFALKAHSARASIRIIAISVPMVLVGLWAVPRIMANSVTAGLVERVFAYLGEDGVDWGGTSGRDVVYSEAWTAFLEAPVSGYGMFSWGMEHYPHNLVMEFLLNGGVLYATMWFMVLLFLFVRVVRMRDAFPGVDVLLPLMVYSLVMLQFSGTYMASGSFWFIVGLMSTLSRRELQDFNKHWSNAVRLKDVAG